MDNKEVEERISYILYHDGREKSKEYLKDVSISFVEWLTDRYYSGKNGWLKKNIAEEAQIAKSTEYLYNTYMKEIHGYDF